MKFVKHVSKLAPLVFISQSATHGQARPHPATAPIGLISNSSAGVQGNDISEIQSSGLSSDGRWTVFYSKASNLDLSVTDTNGTWDVFLHNNRNGWTREISASSGLAGTGESRYASISGDAAYASYFSAATNILQNDTNGRNDIIVYDVRSGTSISASVDDSGAQCNGDCSASFLSANGRFVVFESAATNLDSSVVVPAGVGVQIFVHDRDSDDHGAFDEPGHIRTRLVSFDDSGAVAERAENPTISADGRFVAFEGRWFPGNGNLNCYIHDRDADENGVFDETTPGAVGTTTISVNPLGLAGNAPSDRPWLSADGRWVVFRSQASDLVPGDNNHDWDVFVRGLAGSSQDGITTRVSLNTDGSEAAAPASGYQSISHDGRFVVFDVAAGLAPSDTNGLYDVYLLDRDWDHYHRPNGVFDEAGQTRLERVSIGNLGEGDAFSIVPGVSSDGVYVTFFSGATDLVHGDANLLNDVFMHNGIRVAPR